MDDKSTKYAVLAPSIVQRRSGTGRRLAVLLLLTALQACSTDKTADEYLQDARSYARQGKDDAAAISLRNALRKAPDLVQARVMLGRLYSDHDDYAGAAKELERAWRAGVDDPRLLVELVHAHLMANAPDKAQAVLEDPRAREYGCIATALEGLVLIARGERDPASERFEQALVEDEQCAPAFFGMARLALLKGQPKETLRYLDAVAEMPGLEKARSLLRSQAWLAGRDVEKAIETLQETVRRWPESSHARLALAWAYLRTGDLEGAREQLFAIRKRVRELIPSALLLEGLLAYQDKDYQKARDRLGRIESVMPNNLLLLKLLGGAHAALGEHEQAIGYLTKYVEEVPKDQQVLELLLREQLAVGRLDDALARLDARVRSGQADASLIRALGRLAVATGRYDMLLANLDQVRSGETEGREQEVAELEMLLGQAFLAKGDVDAAIEALQRAYALEGEKQVPGLRLLQIYLVSGRIEEAERLVEELKQANPEDKRTKFAAALLEIARKRPDRARGMLEVVLKEDPDFVPAGLALALLDRQAGRLDAAKARLQELVDRHPGLVQAHLQLAAIAAGENDLQEARKWLEKAHEAGLRTARLRIALLDLHLRLGELEKARTLLEALRRELGNRPFLDFTEVRLLLKEGRRDEAVRVAEKAAARHPEASYLQRLLVNLYLLQGDRDKAFRQLRQVAEHAPRDVLIQARLAEMALDAGEIDVVQHQLERLRSLGAPRAITAYLEAELARHRGDWEHAEALFDESWRLKPNRKTLVRMLLLAERHERATPDAAVQEWLAKHPGDAVVRRLYADHLMNVGRLGQAEAQYRQLLARNPEDAEVLNNLALVALRQGKMDAALEYARKAQSLRPGDLAIRDTLGWVLARAGQYEEARRMLERSGNAPEVLLHRAWVAARMGNKEAARGLLVEALRQSPKLADSDLVHEVRVAVEMNGNENK